MEDWQRLEDRLLMLSPVAPPPHLRRKCLESPPQAHVWHSNKLLRLAAALLIALTVWNFYENYRLRQLTPPTLPIIHPLSAPQVLSHMLDSEQLPAGVSAAYPTGNAAYNPLTWRQEVTLRNR